MMLNLLDGFFVNHFFGFHKEIKMEETYECRGDCIHIHEKVICTKCGTGEDYKYEPKDDDED